MEFFRNTERETSPQQRKLAYDRDGVVVIRDFLSPDDFQALNRNLDRYISEIVPDLPDGDAFYEDRTRPETLKQMQRMQQDTFFADYLSHPVWKQTAELLLGEEANAEGAEWFNKPPGSNHPTPPHQDNFYFCLAPPNVLTMWLALDPVDEENGCLRYVNGSHRPGIRPHSRTKTLGFSQGITDFPGEQDLSHEVKAILNAGDVVIHHGNTIHWAEVNRSLTRHRRSFALVFKGVSCCRDEEAYQRYLKSARSQHTELGLKTNV
ncbi:MAG: phytanoyl-CoA dioxygenase family protein [Planctomyces sp.]|nr:phytanoyl-CoA dioxygenase family protein [Planctomyces sp.]